VQEILVLKDLGLLEKDLRRSRDADALYREALHRAIELGDRSTECWLWGALGFLHLEQLDPADARGPLEQAVALSTELGDSRQCQWEAGLARLCALRQEHAAAAAWIERALVHDAGRSTTLRAWIRGAAAEVAFRAGRRDEAEAELDGLERWLRARNAVPGSRMHQEIQRVRALVGPRR
jgi:tetratricopeptide (TPR) repeat protein